MSYSGLLPLNNSVLRKHNLVTVEYMIAASVYYFAWMCAQLCLILCYTRTAICQIPLSKEVSSKRKLEYIDISSSRDLPEPEMEPKSPVCCIGRQILYYWPTWEAKCTILLRHLKVSGSKTYFIKMIAWWYINFIYSLSAMYQLCWLCYYHNFSLLITVLVYAKQITCPHYPKLMSAMKSPE